MRRNTRVRKKVRHVMSIAITTVAAAALGSVVAVSWIEQVHFLRSLQSQVREATVRHEVLQGRYRALHTSAADWADVAAAHDEALSAWEQLRYIRARYARSADVSFAALVLSRRFGPVS